MGLVGRQSERAELLACLESNRSEFVALYGRRRVGKTFLVRQTLGHRFTFYATGVLDGEGGMAAQLENFNDEIAAQGGAHLTRATNWRQAFTNLHEMVKRAPAGKKVIFLDELPWMATRGSGFLAALDYFWNRWASARNDVVLIVCGSATSWIIQHVVDNQGGLHNRLTRQILLTQFTLRECEEFFRQAGFVMTRYQMTEAYMVFGGVPYYLELMDPRFELYHNIDRLCFAKDARLANEHHNLFRSLFGGADGHLRIVEELAAKAKGLTREELIAATHLPDGGHLSTVLTELEQCGFIRSYTAFGKRERGKLYQLTDPYTLFALRFQTARHSYTDNYWRQYSATPGHAAWSGYAFEQVCLHHIPQIKAKLGISGVLTSISSWRSSTHDPGAQVDLVIDRADHVVNLCEIKYCVGEYTIDKPMNRSLRNKAAAFTAETKTRKAVRTTLITTFGLVRNEYAAEILAEVTLDDLFAAT
ncbi:MAG: ATP-binding protein [Bifidobacteriaceae bacterium]|jgi:AAA+ ATPase superfamily predicted ATPase|nr:ATP-binding protein [Bifidobacteriaceae bacterium]